MKLVLLVQMTTRCGPLFTHFDMVWPLRSTQEFLDKCLPTEQNPLVHLEGFNVSMLTLGTLF
jgi:hypothetical protein